MAQQTIALTTELKEPFAIRLSRNCLCVSFLVGSLVRPTSPAVVADGSCYSVWVWRVVVAAVVDASDVVVFGVGGGRSVDRSVALFAD